MEKIHRNSIKKNKMDLHNRKMTNNPPSPVTKMLYTYVQYIYVYINIIILGA